MCINVIICTLYVAQRCNNMVSLWYYSLKFQDNVLVGLRKFKVGFLLRSIFIIYTTESL